MIDVYTAATPNGHMISIALNQLQLSHSIYVLSVDKKERKTADLYSWTRAIFANNYGTFSVLKPITILVSLAEKVRGLLPQWAKDFAITIHRLVFQMGNVGPVQRQAKCLADEYSGVNIAAFLLGHEGAKGLNNVMNWMIILEADSVVQKGLAVPLCEKQCESSHVVSSQSMVVR